MLHSSQIQYLHKHFRVSNHDPVDILSFQRVYELMDLNTCRAYLNRIAKKFHTSSLLVTASQFAKRYTFMLVLPALYTMSVYNKGLDINPKNCFIQSMDEHEVWLPRLALADWRVSRPQKDRDLWRRQLIKQLFTDNIASMWSVLHRITGIQLSVLWENTAVYIYWLYQQRLKSIQNQERSQGDYEFLLYQTDSEVFGESIHPLQKFHLSKGCRRTCCLYYLTNQESKICKGCPRQRIRRKPIHSMVLS